jgi:two-component system, NarL family, response regulator DevR
MSEPAPIRPRPTGDVRRVRILIADDHEVVRIGLAALLARQEGFEVVGEASSGREAVEVARRLRPDVVVLDIRMPGGSGTDACRTITAELPDTPVIMLTSYADEEALFESISAGASGYVLKRIGSHELVNAIRTVASGGSLLDPSVTSAVLARLRQATNLQEGGVYVDLTDQERRVLARLAEGASNREIAESMALAEKTVRNYVSSILAKLGLASRAQAAAHAVRHRLSELDPEHDG